jgi:SAM-dependent methyltransferase
MGEEGLPMMDSEPGYAQRVEQQIQQYANTDNMHALLPHISEYWKNKFTRNRSFQIFGVHNHYQFYSQPFMRAIINYKCPDVASIGCGDGSIEVIVAKIMHQRGVLFRFHLFELSPILLEKAAKNVAAAGLTGYFRFHQLDINSWEPPIKYAAFMAHHSLHHIQNLEHVFDAVKASVLGYFCTMDMIGRNGHMRWPEVLELVQLFWAILPVEKRKHHIIPGFEKEFINWDCSTQGFEGIRAQNILPCLVERFGFDGFLAYGGLIDPFVGRGFGRHYDAGREEDRALVDLIGTINDLLIDLGYIKPTKMAAVMTPQQSQAPRVYRHWSPQFCIRWPSHRPTAIAPISGTTAD